MMPDGSHAIAVNGICIAESDVNAEMQYHPASTLDEAKIQATRAIVIRELLLQRAAEIGLCTLNEAVKNPDPIIDSLLEQEVAIPDADEAVCRRYYDNNKGKFFTSPLFEVSHILYPAAPNDGKAREAARKCAQNAIDVLLRDPQLFEQMAKSQSACSSAAHGGALGQISKGQTMPAFEAALFKMKQGELSAVPVETEVGFHVIKVHKRAEGEQLPFDAAKDWIKNYLVAQCWNRAFNQYVKLLASRADIQGFELGVVTSPLVQ